MGRAGLVWYHSVCTLMASPNAHLRSFFRERRKGLFEVRTSGRSDSDVVYRLLQCVYLRFEAKHLLERFATCVHKNHCSQTPTFLWEVWAMAEN